MNLDKIKTKDEFLSFADIWYQRTISLVETWQNREESEKRRVKAFKLWCIMYERMSKITQTAIEISKPKPRKNIKRFESAIVGQQKEDSIDEFILTPDNREIVSPPSNFRFK